MKAKITGMVVVVEFLVWMAIVALTIFLLAEDSYSDTYMTGMVGVFNTGKHSVSESKFLNIGQRDYLGLGLSYQYEIGGWSDTAGQGRSSSAYGAYQIGVQTDKDVVARAMVGPALVTSPDAYLGGILQLTEDFYLGLKGTNGNTVGIKYKHFSSGGIEQPNVGRDYMGFEVGIPF